jgi:hypothetical protein
MVMSRHGMVVGTVVIALLAVWFSRLGGAQGQGPWRSRDASGLAVHLALGRSGTGTGRLREV